MSFLCTIHATRTGSRGIRRVPAALGLALATAVTLAACSDAPLPTDPGGPFSPPEISADIVGICTGATMPAAECAALFAIYAETGGDSWQNNDGWLTHPNPCTWDGVVCSMGASGSVMELNFRFRGLSSTGFPEAFAAFPELVVLDLHGNHLPGPIPPALGSLAHLEVLDLQGNEITGAIPPELGNLPAIRTLVLAINALTGTLPPEFGNLTTLEHFDLRVNEVAGTLPATLGNLSSLRALYLSLNGLSGAIPSAWGNLVGLDTLDLGHNELTGTVPATFASLTAVKRLDLGSNQFTGPFPTVLTQMTALTWLELDRNQFSGPLPPQIEGLDALRIVDLRQNQITGPLPVELAAMDDLQELTLSSNPIGGELPAWIGTMPSLTMLLMDDTGLVGAVPAGLGDFGSRLKTLALRHNGLTGNLPEALTQLTGLTTFTFRQNPLSGVLSLTMAEFAQAVDFCELYETDLFVPDLPVYRAIGAGGDGLICGIEYSSAEDLEEDIEDGVGALVPDPLNAGQGNALATKIENAIAKAATGQYQVAINQLLAFISQVEAMVSNGTLSPAEAQALLDQAQALIDIWTTML